MDVNEGIDIIQTILGRQLNAVELWTIAGVWEGKDYRQMAKESQIYKYNYLRGIGSDLWQSLARDLLQQVDFDRQVTKRNIKSVLLWYKQEHRTEAHLDRPRSSWNQDGIDQTSSSEVFYGREQELATLRHWSLTDRCRLICLLGMGGMGKSSLVCQLADQIRPDFDLAILRSLVNAPKIEDLLTDILGCTIDLDREKIPTTLAGQLKILLKYFKKYRCLLVLDNLESILQAQSQAGQYLSGYDGYARLFQLIGELPHQSCIILISSEKPQHLGILETTQSKFIKTFNLGGLGIEQGYRLVREHGAPPFKPEIWQSIYNHYSGNPLALKIATITAVDMSGGGENIYQLLPLLNQPYYQFDRIEDIMARQFDRLSTAEQQIVYWLAIEREPMTLGELTDRLIPNTVDFELVSVLQSLQRRCITLRPDRHWSLEPVMMGYVVRRFISELVAELTPPHFTPDRSIQDVQERLVLLNSHAIVSPYATEHQSHIQFLTILQPLLQQTIEIWGNQNDLKNYLQQILQAWEALDPLPEGYFRANLNNLFSHL